MTESKELKEVKRLLLILNLLFSFPARSWQLHLQSASRVFSSTATLYCHDRHNRPNCTLTHYNYHFPVSKNRSEISISIIQYSSVYVDYGYLCVLCPKQNAARYVTVYMEMNYTFWHLYRTTLLLWAYIFFFDTFQYVRENILSASFMWWIWSIPWRAAIP